MGLFRCTSIFRVVLLVLVTVGSARIAKADSYTIKELATNAVGLFNVGLTDDDVLVTQDIRYAVPYVYDTFTLPSTVPTLSNSIPSVTFDSGTKCSPAVGSGLFGAEFGVCNNGHEAFLSHSTNGAGLYVGPDLSDLLFSGYVDDMLVNSYGDIAFIYAGTYDVNYIAIDDTSHAAAVTPEPSSFVLLATGLMLLFVAARWRKSSMTSTEMV